MRMRGAMSGLMLGFSVPSLAMGEARQSFTVTNPSDFERPDAIIDLPVPAARGAWTARVHGRLLPAQKIGGTVRLVATLARHEKLAVDLIPGPAPARPSRVRATLNVRDEAGRYRLRETFKVPAAHSGTDGLIAFEGIGWESDRAGYRIYLDGRNVVDLFGKIRPDIVYRSIGQGVDDYQYPRAWGGDIFKVGTSLGVGGIGLLRDGHPTQIGPASLTARILSDGPVTATIGVDADAIGGGKGFVHAVYAITAGSALTQATIVAGAIEAPLTTGLTVHPGDQTIRSTPSSNGWSYIAVWGAQEHGPDEVGWALFYRSADIVGEPAQDAANLYIRFKSETQARYHFAGRWTQENRLVPGYKPIANLPEFRAWLDRQRVLLAQPVSIAPAR